MFKLALNLPKYRLLFESRIIKRRASAFNEPLIPTRKHISKYRGGHTVSRFFRYVFEHKKIRRVLGTNLALMVVATSFVPTNKAEDIQISDAVVTTGQTQLNTEKSVQYPVHPVSVTQGFKVFHPGIDLDGVTGDPIYPIKPGTVEAISHSKYAYGNAVIINHGDQITSLYAHLSKIEVSEGQEVGFTTEIGKMGATGHASGDHLHLEIRDHGRPINPYTLLPR